MKSKDIYKLVSTAVGFDATKKTRKRKYIYAKAIANKLSKKFTTESLAEIGKNTNSDHATVLHSIKEFENTYKYQSDPINVLGIYNKLYHVCNIKTQAEDIEQVTETNFNNLLEENIMLKETLNSEKQKRIDAEYNFRKMKRRKSKIQHPLLHLLHNIPEEHIESVKLKLDAIIKCLPKKNLPQINNANN